MNALHPATLMDTKMVRDTLGRPHTHRRPGSARDAAADHRSRPRRRQRALLQRARRGARRRPSLRPGGPPPALGAERAAHRVTRWIVDGMNVIGSRPDGWWRDRRGAMRRLVEELGSLASTSGEPVTVVLDGAPFDLDGGPVEVRFASRRGPNAADDDIAALVAADASTGRPARGHLGRRARSGACASTAPRWRARGRSGRRLDGLAAVADPRYRIALLDWLACAARRGGGARRAGGGRPRRPGGGGRHGRPRARLRRHLPARASRT